MSKKQINDFSSSKTSVIDSDVYLEQNNIYIEDESQENSRDSSCKINNIVNFNNNNIYHETINYSDTEDNKSIENNKNKNIHLLKTKKIKSNLNNYWEESKNDKIKIIDKPNTNYNDLESKINKTDSINGYSKKSAILFNLIYDQLDLRIRKEFKKMSLIIKSKYKDKNLNLDESFCEEIILI